MNHDIAPKKNESVSEGYTVVLPAGGEGLRLKTFTQDGQVHKSVIKLSNGRTMIENTIGLYRDSGVKNFVVLTYHGVESVTDILQDGAALGVDIRYSHDPGRAVGRGGAIKHALNSGVIESGQRVIVHNSDDVIYNYEGNFVNDLISHHDLAEMQGQIVTIVAVRGTRYPYTGFFVENNLVKSIETYPFIDVPAHTGVSIFSPSALKMFDQFDLSRKTDFEPIIFPQLAELSLLSAMLIDSDCWLPVNEPKALQTLLQLIDNGIL